MDGAAMRDDWRWRVFGAAAALCLLTLAGARGADEPAEKLVEYIARYNRLGEKDVDARLELAAWCAQRGLAAQQMGLLREAVKLDARQEAAYRLLLETDAKHARPVDEQWAGRLLDLPGADFRLFHSAHFTLLSDTDELTMRGQAEAMEETYRTFYEETSRIGLRALPPEGRLVSVLFSRREAYRDFLRRFEGVGAEWAAGMYSWRTNRCAFYHDRDNPAFKEPREKLTATDAQIEELRAEMAALPEAATGQRLQIQGRLKKLKAERDEIALRLSAVTRLTTLAKARHEVSHQLFYNSGLLKRGTEYPFWLNEGLAMVFEVGDEQGRGSPRMVNQFRLKTYRTAQRDGKLIGLEELLAEHPGEGEDAIVVAEKYAQAWGLMYFLWNRRTEQLKGFLEDASAEQQNWGRLFVKRFGELQALEEEMRRFVGGL